MKISARKVAPDVYALDFDDTEVVLDGKEIKMLLVQVMQTLAPGGSTQKDTNRSKQFMRHIKNANDVGIQKLLLVADRDDLLVLLKSGEADEVLQEKFFGNMSDNNRKIFQEDLLYKFQEEVPQAKVKKSINRLIEKAKDLEVEGTLVYENVMSR